MVAGKNKSLHLTICFHKAPLCSGVISRIEIGFYVKTINIMAKIQIEDLLLAGAHFGHLTRRWNPKMKKYIFMDRNGIHIIDLKKSLSLLEDAYNSIIRMILPTPGRYVPIS